MEISELYGVHIRQGDFITSGHLGYSVASKEYIEQAIDYFKTRYNCTFLIATNGKTDWISSIFSSISNIQYHFTNLKAYVDMAVLSSCDHVITSTGTFSWWIGYFSKGTVLYYKDFPKKGSWLMTTQFEDMGDYFLPGWIGLPQRSFDPFVKSASNYMFKVNHGNTRTRSEIFSKFKGSKLQRSYSVCIVNFDQVNTDWEDLEIC